MAETKKPSQKEKKEYVKVSSLNTALQFFDTESPRFPDFYATGIPELDRVLGGGIGPGLTVLGAESNLGKSTLALQIAQHIARQGRAKVLYFSFEMDSLQVAAKCIYRQVFLDITGVTDGRRPTPQEVERCGQRIGMLDSVPLSNNARYRALNAEERDRIRTAIGELREQGISDNMMVLERREPLFSAEDVRRETEAWMDAPREDGPRETVVFVDYLQNLSSPGNQGLTDKQQVDRNVGILADLARTRGIPVIVISSMSRAGYDKEVRKGSFKESGNIEYSADVLLGLQLGGVKQKGFDNKQAMADYPRKMEIVVLKQRYGSSGAVVNVLFYPAAAHFMEDPSEESSVADVSEPVWRTTRRTGRKKAEEPEEPTPQKSRKQWGYL